MNDSEQLLEQGNLLFTSGRFAEAEACYRQAYELQSDRAETANNLGVALVEQGRCEEGLSWYRCAIGINRQYYEAHFNSGNVLRLLTRWDEACGSYEEALKVQPNAVSALTNLALAHGWAGRVELAIKNYERAITADPRSAAAHNGLGLMFQRFECLDEAERCFDRAVELDPQLPYPHVNRAQLWLLRERLVEGFREFQWRWRLPDISVAASMPAWNGEPVDGRRVLLWTEQGTGDSIMLVRFAQDVQSRGAYVLLHCPPGLHALFGTCPFIDRVCDGSEPDLDADFHCPLFDLPRILHTTMDLLSRNTPYLRSEDAHSRQWSSRLASMPGFKIGVAWQGNRTYPEDCHRSIPLKFFAPVAAVEEVTLVSLQMGDGAQQTTDSDLPFPLVDWTDAMDQDGAFVDTAALLPQLDLVITCDTAVGHLAGALGVPVWIALSTACDWRWFTGRTDSPWYPTVRLYRQSRLDDWHEVFEEMARDVRQLVPNRTA